MIDLSFSVQNFISLINPRQTRVVHKQPIEKMVWDTRGLEGQASFLFIALKGPHHDGHAYVSEAYKKGVRHFLVSQKIDFTGIPDANVYLVDDTVATLQLLALHMRRSFPFPVVAITGSNGKTIVKEWLFQLLTALQPEPVFRSPKSFNSQIGVALSVLMAANGNYAYGIFEAGISFPGEMQKLEQILQPSFGIFTNIGSAHQANFSSLQEKALEKALLFKGAQFVVYSSAYPEIERSFDLLNIPPEKRVSWGKRAEDAYQIIDQVSTAKGVEILLAHKGENENLFVPFFDPGSIENVLHAYVFLRKLHFSHKNIQKAIYQLSSLEMRLEVKNGRNNCIIINDTYNSDIHSIQNAFKYIDRFTNKDKRTVILSDILQTNFTQEALHAFLLKELLDHHVNRIITIGHQFSSLAVPKEIQHKNFTSTEQFIVQLPEEKFQNELILLKGSRIFAFERIGVLLEEKLHRTKLEIDLSAVSHNLQEIRSRFSSDVKIIAMLKAFGYGSGSIELARFLAFRNVHYLAVANTDEGVELRKAGIHLPIIVLEPAENDFFDIVLHDLELEIFDFNILGRLIDFIKQFSPFITKPIPVHIKLDTGMHRLGFQLEELDRLIEVLKNQSAIKVISVFSHFSAADDPSHDDFTRAQFALFLQMSEKLQQALGYPIMRHIANSAAAVRFPEMALDAVRLGISLLGQSLVKDTSLDLQPVLRFTSPIIEIKEIKPGESVGYNRRWIKDYPRRVGILPLGYADGLDRRLGNETWHVFYQDRFLPLVGDVCMDMCFVDLTEVPHARIGDEIEIFGPHARVEIMAQKLETIPYEIFTRIGKRVNRVYIE